MARPAVVILAPQVISAGFGSMSQFLRWAVDIVKSADCEVILLDSVELGRRIQRSSVARLWIALGAPWLPLFWIIASKELFWRPESKCLVISQEYCIPLFFRRQCVICHDLIQYYFPRNRLSYMYYRLLLPWILRRAGVVVANSQATRRYLASVYRISSHFCCGVPYSFPAARENCGAPRQEVVRFVWVGTAAKHKGLDLLVAALCLARVKMGGQLISGSVVVPQRDCLVVRQMFENANLGASVFVCSELSEGEMRNLYLNSNSVVSTSLLEGYCIPLLEGAVNGCRPIAPNRAIFRELWSEVGCIYKPRDADSLARVLSAPICRLSDFEWSSVMEIVQRNDGLVQESARSLRDAIGI